MNKQILVVYKSVTGFTKQYAEWIAEKLNCSAVELKKVSAETMSEYKTIIFGGRFHAGFVDGLKNAKALFEKSTAEKLIVFATGATPNSATEMIEEAWKNNLTTEEMDKVPHFYMQGGLRYENMPFGDKLMMKVFAAMVKRKKEKSEYEKEMLKALNTSYDHTSKEYIEPLADFVRGGGTPMNGHLGFSYVGLLFLSALFIPNIIWTKNLPQGYTSENENKILLAFERLGEVLTCCCALIFSDFNLHKWTVWSWWLIAAALMMVLHELWWIRYFRSNRKLSDFYSGFLGIPLAGATLPVAAFILLGIYGKVLWLILSAVILGIGHIGIHIQHKRKINE